MSNAQRVSELFNTGRYFCTASGEIWSLYKAELRRKRPKRLTPTLTGAGYLHVGLVGTWITIHRALWIYFNGPIPEGLQINHKDGNKRNNALENLELVTPIQNQRHAIEQLGYGYKLGSGHPHSKLNEQIVLQIRDKLVLGQSERTLAKEYSVSRENISQIKHRRTWKHI